LLSSARTNLVYWDLKERTDVRSSKASDTTKLKLAPLQLIQSIDLAFEDSKPSDH
jgi:hypothetical protein